MVNVKLNIFSCEYRLMPQPILRKAVRILRPIELTLLFSELSFKDRVFFNALFFTGMRYVEVVRLHENMEWFEGKFINLPKGAIKKVKVEFDERSVRLNIKGQKAIKTFLSGPQLPTRAGWGQILKKAAIRAGLDPVGLCAKTTRKTWESWLTIVNKNNNTALNLITLSQGHTKETSISHYLGLPFTRYEEKEMIIGSHSVSEWL